MLAFSQHAAMQNGAPKLWRVDWLRSRTRQSGIMNALCDTYTLLIDERSISFRGDRLRSMRRNANDWIILLGLFRLSKINVAMKNRMKIPCNNTVDYILAIYA